MDWQQLQGENVTPEQKKRWAVAVALIDRARIDVAAARLAVALFAEHKLRMATLTAELELLTAAEELARYSMEDATHD